MVWCGAPGLVSGGLLEMQFYGWEPVSGAGRRSDSDKSAGAARVLREVGSRVPAPLEVRMERHVS